MENIERLHPRAFTKFCMSIGMVPSSYTSALTYEEQLLWFCSYLEKNVIPAVNNNAEALEEVQNLMVQLQDYVNNYFDNLDVQEEINNKLDDMAEQGQLTDIIAQYLQLAGVLAYDNKAAMKAAENLVAGSIAKTLGDTSYQDGYGYFYKVRQVRNTDIIDDILIVQLHDVNLVAERIPEPEIGHLENLKTNDKGTIIDAINNSFSSQTLEMGKSVTYDLPSTDTIGHVQASCTNGNYLYTAVVGDTNVYPIGYIYVFNIVTNEYVEKYTVNNMYHGNDMCYLNGKIYIARVDDNKLTEYDLSNNTSTTIEPFSEYSDYLTVGISTLNDRLVAWLSPSPDNVQTNLLSDKFVMINNDETLTELEFEDPYKVLNVITGYITRQQFDIDEESNLVYFLIQNPNVLVEATIINNKIKLQSLYNIPSADFSENLIGETESIAVVKNNSFSKGSLFLTAREFKSLKDGTQYGKDTIQNYIVNPKISTTFFASSSKGYHQGQQNHFNYLTVKKNNVSNLIETGSSDYPIKDLIRAMNQVKWLKEGSAVIIRDSESYYLPYLFGYDVKILIDTGCSPTIYLGDIDNCKINIETTGTGKLTIRPVNSNKRITITQSEIRLYGASSASIEFINCQIQLQESKFSDRNTKVTINESVSSGYAFQVLSTSIMHDQTTFDISTSDKYFYYSNGSVLITDKSGANVVKAGYAVLIPITA